MKVVSFETISSVALRVKVLLHYQGLQEGCCLLAVGMMSCLVPFWSFECFGCRHDVLSIYSLQVTVGTSFPKVES